MPLIKPMLGVSRHIGRDCGFVGMTSFGASALADVLFEKFGITLDAIVAEANSRLDKRRAA